MDSPTPRRGPEQLQTATARQVLLADLHARLIRRDPNALERLAEELIPFLKRTLRKRFRSAAEDLIVDATVDAFLEYAAHPHRLEASFACLDRVLLYAARRNLINFLEADRRRRLRESRYLEYVEGTLDRRDPFPNGLDASSLQCLLSVAVNEGERKALRQWFAGERAVRPLAALLGRSDAPLTEQRKEVKRFKDRIIKRLRRRSVKK